MLRSRVRPRPLALLVVVVACLGALTGAAFAARDPSAPRLTRIALSPTVTPEALLRAGLDVIEIHRGSSCVILEWPGDAARLAALGASAEVLDDDPGATEARRANLEYAARRRLPGKTVLSAARPDGILHTEVLPPFGSGSLAGFWTLEEVKMKLDDLVASDAHDVVADKIDTLGWTLQGRPIWGLALGKRVTGTDTRPVVFFNALTHAREPGGMQALLYFVDDILGKYGTDPVATSLLDQRRIYIVPVVNPDGYKINEDYYFSIGGVAFGYHRKNARDTNNNGLVDRNTDGIDINRNYGYQWGLDDVGSSPNPADETYRGPAPFSEPETQAERDVVTLLQPKTGISFHTYGDLFIHPWGWTAQATSDSLTFYEWDDEATLGSGYQSGQGIRVLYAVNGEFTDWCYGETVLKPKMLAWTPELGGPSDGFWPPASRILPIAVENLRACYTATAAAGPWVRIERFSLAEGALDRGSIAHLVVRARNRGLAASPPLTAMLVPLSTGTHVWSANAALPSIGSFQSFDQPSAQSFAISADDTVTLGRLLRFQVNFADGAGFYSRDTVEVYCGTPTVVLADDASSGLGNWSTTWGIQNGDAYRPGPFFADSPGGIYSNNSTRALTSANGFDLSHGVHAYIDFKTRWEFEVDVDCGIVEANVQGKTFVALPAHASVPGNTGAQPPGQPVFEGAGKLWRAERADLSAFAGPGNTSVKVRFRALSDNGANFDGFNVDSIRVIAFDPAAQPAPVAVGDVPGPTALALEAPVPNPAGDAARFSFALPRAARTRLEVLDVAGRRVRLLADHDFTAARYEFGWDLRDAAGRRVAPGIYLLRLSSGVESRTRRLVVL
jgi:hypothetical protein